MKWTGIIHHQHRSYTSHTRVSYLGLGLLAAKGTTEELARLLTVLTGEMELADDARSSVDECGVEPDEETDSDEVKDTVGSAEVLLG